MSMLRKWSVKVQQKETHDGSAPFSAKEHQEESTSIALISSSSHPSQ